MTPNMQGSLAAHYSRFRVSERTLLTGHSHQAWPDVAFDGQQQAWLDAAMYVDDKWTRAEAQAAEVRAGFAALLCGGADDIALAQSTHELVTRWLSALSWDQRRKVITSDGEFHSLRRQLARLAEAGLVELTVVPARPAETLAARLASSVDDRTACAMVSSVLYETAEIVPNVPGLAQACRHHGVPFLVDAYHHLNVVPFDIDAMDLADAFVTGGGYKYCQLGEGNAFLRVPPGCNLRPIITGWFAEYAAVTAGSAGDRGRGSDRDRVSYAPGAAAFAGATYDPASHYRAASVFAFHRAQGFTAAQLRDISQRQVGRLLRGFEQLDIDPRLAHVEPMPHARRGGFLAIRTAHARTLVTMLRERQVSADARGDILRLGPAPYLIDTQLDDGIAALDEALRRVQADSRREADR